MKSTLSAILLVFAMTGFAQVNPIYQNLEFSNCTSGYFWTQAPSTIALPDGSDFIGLNYNYV